MFSLVFLFGGMDTNTQAQDPQRSAVAGARSANMAEGSFRKRIPPRRCAKAATSWLCEEFAERLPFGWVESKRRPQLTL